jgi:polyhydroxybutyrate depolymerase
MIAWRQWRVFGSVGLACVLAAGCAEESDSPQPGVYQFPAPSTAGDGDGAADGGNATAGDGDNLSPGDGDGNNVTPGDGDGDNLTPGDGDGDGDTSQPGADAGTPDAGNPVEPQPTGTSAGCGKADFPASGQYNIDVGGTSRMYIVKLPSGYDRNKPYKLVFTWHYLGGSAAGIARSYYGLESLSQGSAIFVSPEGIDAGWANTGGRDVAFAKAMVSKFKADYCIDEGRVFSAGFSYGAIMSNTVGCAMGDVFRAIAPMAGSGPRTFGGSQCTGQVAAWLYHGTSDGTVSFNSGVGSRDHWIATNHCDTETEAPDANGCVAYKGCDPGFPVVWCQVAGAGHTQPRFGASAIWAFFSQF